MEQLNNFEQNQIDWIHETDKIVPGRIKVSQLDKIKFLNGLVFREISKKLYHSEYSSAFYLNKRPTHYSKRDNDNIHLPESLKDSAYLKYWHLAFAQNHEYIIRTGLWRIGKPHNDLIQDLKKMRDESYQITPKISNIIYNFTADLVGFKYTPHIFYSFKTVSSYTNQIPYELVTEEVTKTSLECQFILRDTIENAEFVIEWLAIGP
ncbi:hypothetical protein BpHYR1_048800 [Brachionus plicatilis]|uniref:Uncharacterized protein n=1 Tax=Brachionus plicatilis TaxID=10195 RepID=A0A3M7RJ78_BRAPC|nr:hypothetical protein BpHYR1_048800 [Brachionus plicatilis]